MRTTHKLFTVSVLVTFLCGFANANKMLRSNDFSIVNTNLGQIQGRYLESRLGMPFLAYTGIRYAEPPIDELRFQPPVPVKPWDDTFDATEDGPFCVQPTKYPEQLTEDCLRLNVYTRNINPSEKRPVIVYFHSGGFYSSSGQSSLIGPQHFLDHDIVLVTVNYRLGILGFLATGTKEAPGNNGLKDQVEALKWVRDNIANFGGDSNSVTIMGYSAGGTSNTLHLLSPMSKGLYHRAIVMSGPATAQWEYPTNQLEIAKKQARLLNCSDESVETIMDCLRKADKLDFASTGTKLFEFAGGQPILLFKPVLEPDFGQERFLIDDPTCLIKNGQFEKVNVMAGLTEYEFIHPAIYILKNDTLREQMITQFDKWAPVCFLYERDTPKSKEISSKLRRHYFDTESADWLQFDGFKDIYRDSVVSFGIHRFVELAKAHTKLYHYEFTYTGRYSHTYYPGDKPYGAVHHDELLYLFRVPSMTPEFKKFDPENDIIQYLTGWWTNFAETGNPNEGEFDSPVEWEPTSPEVPKYLKINENPSIGNVLFPKRFDIWDRLFPLDERCNRND